MSKCLLSYLEVNLMQTLKALLTYVNNSVDHNAFINLVRCHLSVST